MIKMKLNLIVMTGMFFLSGCFSVEQMENEESASTNEEKTRYDPEAHDESTSHPSTTVDSDSTEESSTEEPAVEPETSGLSLTYNQRAQYLTLYTNCINCHNNARGIDFGDVDVAVNNVELALSDSNIDASSGEDAVVDAAISSLVDLYRTQGDGGPLIERVMMPLVPTCLINLVSVIPHNKEPISIN